MVSRAGQTDLEVTHRTGPFRSQINDSAPCRFSDWSYHDCNVSLPRCIATTRGPPAFLITADAFVRRATLSFLTLDLGGKKGKAVNLIRGQVEKLARVVADHDSVSWEDELRRAGSDEERF